MRWILFAVYILFAYYALRAMLRRLPRAGSKPVAGEMALDPQCKVYVLKDGAVVRRIAGRLVHFCSEECAAAHAARG